MFLSKEASNKDVTLKTQMMVSLKDAKAESSSECIWMENGFFMGQRTDMTIAKANFPENTLLYVNQESISPVKNGYAIYPDFVILTQILPLANPPPEINLDTHEFKDNEALLFVPLYNTENGLYRGLTKQLARITLRDDKNETFYSYGLTRKNQNCCFVLIDNQYLTCWNVLHLKSAPAIC